jgi:hypothetical protein
MPHQDHADHAMHIDQPWSGEPYIYNTNYQCDPTNNDSLSGGTLGVTIWRDTYEGGPDIYISPNDTVTISFTGTQPGCYLSKDSCNIYFDPIVLSPGDTTNDAELKYKLNGIPEDPQDWAHLCHISGVVGHPAIQAYDLAPVTGYNDIGLNTLVIKNFSNSATAELIDFQIFRTYHMKTLGNDCSAANNTVPNGTLDDLRNDYPCNMLQCGGRSFLLHRDPTYNNNDLAPNDHFSWFFDWTKTQNDSSAPYNYADKDICLFNFNQIVTQADSADNDVRLFATLNGQGLVTFWLPKKGTHSSFPSYNLTKSSAYNDMGPNQLTLTNLGDVSVRMVDNYGVDVYRIYKTESCCHTDHSDHSDTAHSDYTYDDHSDVVHSDVAHQDAAAHSDVSHADVGHSDTINHSNYTDWYYYHDASYPDTSLHSNNGGPYTDFSDHFDYGPGHGDVAHSDVPHSDAGTYYNHSDTSPYPWPHVDYWGQPYSDIAHNDFNNHSDST